MELILLLSLFRTYEKLKHRVTQGHTAIVSDKASI